MPWARRRRKGEKQLELWPELYRLLSDASAMELFHQAAARNTERHQRRRELARNALRARRIAQAASQLRLWPWMPPASRPRTLFECIALGFRPCPFFSCRYHLKLDVDRSGRLRDNFPGVRIEDMSYTCAWDFVRDHPEGASQYLVAPPLGINRPRVDQVEDEAFKRIEEWAIEHGEEAWVEALRRRREQVLVPAERLTHKLKGKQKCKSKATSPSKPKRPRPRR